MIYLHHWSDVWWTHYKILKKMQSWKRLFSQKIIALSEIPVVCRSFWPWVGSNWNLAFLFCSLNHLHLLKTPWSSETHFHSKGKGFLAFFWLKMGINLAEKLCKTQPKKSGRSWHGFRRIECNGRKSSILTKNHAIFPQLFLQDWFLHKTVVD